MDYQEKARRLVVLHANDRLEKTDSVELKFEQTFVVWFAKTLQNWKALVSTELPDGMYYEVTYNGDKEEAYVDSYKKWENKAYPDGMYDGVRG